MLSVQNVCVCIVSVCVMSSECTYDTRVAHFLLYVKISSTCSHVFKIYIYIYLHVFCFVFSVCLNAGFWSRSAIIYL